MAMCSRSLLAERIAHGRGRLNNKLEALREYAVPHLSEHRVIDAGTRPRKETGSRSTEP